eukprot:EC123536.1.p1 GENE.EC123536.1~~EC123536.1.p1  ORF type:complete len:188 (+),score=22.47 EC123536.1:49-612(+)
MAPAFVPCLPLSGNVRVAAPSTAVSWNACSRVSASTAPRLSISKAPTLKFSFSHSLISRKFSASLQRPLYPTAPHFIIRAEEEDVNARIEKMINDNKIMIFIKGSKIMPQCGFSNTVVQIMNRAGVPYETYDVLSDPEIRQGTKEFSSWPTIPQVYINGEFVGGCDILIDLYQNGELEQMLEGALGS